MKKIAVIGAGTWGTALAKLLADKGHNVALWVYEKDLAEDIKKTGINTKYLPDLVLPEKIKVSTLMEDVLKDAGYVINVVPTQHTRKVFSSAIAYISDDAQIISASKGIEKETLLTVSRILRELSGQKIAVLSGPSFAKEVIE